MYVIMFLGGFDVCCFGCCENVCVGFKFVVVGVVL